MNKRVSYKPGYDNRQRQRELVVKLLRTGFNVDTIQAHMESKYSLNSFDASRVIRYVQISLSRAEG